MQAAGAKIIPPALKHGIGELDRQDFFEQRKVFTNQLLLQIDGVGGDDRFFTVGRRVEDARNKIAETFADSGARFDEQMFVFLKCASNRGGHLLLLGAVFEIAAARENARFRKDAFDFGNQPGQRHIFESADHR